MLIFLLGLPNQFTQWCEALIAKLAERASRSLLRSSAGSSEELLQVMIEHPSQHIFVSQRQPGNWLHRILAAANGRCVVALADPRACVAELAAGPDSNLIEIIRAVASSCATLTSYLSLPGSLVLRAEEHSLDPIATARRIADHLQLPSADEDILAVLDTISPLDPDAVVTVAWENRFDAPELALINGALAGYGEYFTGTPLGNLVWAPNLFIVGDTHQRLTGPIDITGRSRCLIYGPYIRLPRLTATPNGPDDTFTGKGQLLIVDGSTNGRPMGIRPRPTSSCKGSSLSAALTASSMRSTTRPRRPGVSAGR
jgi:hypothetical protein